MTLRAIIADDSSVIRRMLRRALHDAFVAKFDLAEAATRAEVLDLARGEAFDVIFLDWHLPACRGEEIVSELRRQRPDRALQIVLIAGSVNESTIEEAARRSGADAWVGRPFDNAQLHDRLGALMALQEQREVALAAQSR